MVQPNSKDRKCCLGVFKERGDRKAEEGSGMIDKEGSGTTNKEEGSGTTDKEERSGTIIKEEGSGTIDKGRYLLNFLKLLISFTFKPNFKLSPCEVAE